MITLMVIGIGLVMIPYTLLAVIYYFATKKQLQAYQDKFVDMDRKTILHNMLVLYFLCGFLPYLWVIIAPYIAVSLSKKLQLIDQSDKYVELWLVSCLVGLPILLWFLALVCIRFSVDLNFAMP